MMLEVQTGAGHEVPTRHYKWQAFIGRHWETLTKFLQRNAWMARPDPIYKASKSLRMASQQGGKLRGCCGYTGGKQCQPGLE